MVSIYTLFVSPNEIHDLTQYYPLICNHRQVRMQGYKRLIDKKLSVFGEVVAKIALEHELGSLKGTTFYIKPNNNMGVDVIGDYKISVSHSDNLVAVVIAHQQIGIDIEHIHQFTLDGLNERVIDRFFNVEEQEFVQGATDRITKAKRFYLIWTRKEALMKYYESGISLHQMKSYSAFYNKGFYFSKIYCGYALSTYCHTSDSIRIINLSEEVVCDWCRIQSCKSSFIQLN